MECGFETPHPSIQTQDQKFKLPSSKPCYSPNLSPVPIATKKPRNLKENRVSTPWTELTSKTLTSSGRPASVSSSNSSSSRKSKEPQIRTAKKSLEANMKPRSSKLRHSNFRSSSGMWALASPFVSRASSPINDQAPNINAKDLSPPKGRPIPRTSIVTNLGKRGLSDTFYNPNLPSLCNQTRIAKGLHEREQGKVYYAHSAHTSPSKAASSVLLDLNALLKQKRRKGGHRGTVSVDSTHGNTVASYPEDLGGGAKTKKKCQRERRPSAPSSYSRRPRPHALPSAVGAPLGLEGTQTSLASGLEMSQAVNKDGTASTGTGVFTVGITKHINDADGFVLQLHDKSITPAAPDMEMNWRVGMVDFNRPPSQMCHYPTTTLLSGWAGGDVFSSSGSEGFSSEGEDEDDKGPEGTQTMLNPNRASRTRTWTARPSTSGPRFVLPQDLDLDQSVFGDGAWEISTPLKTQIQIQTRKKEKARKKREEKMIMRKATSISDLRSRNGGLVRMRSLPVMSNIRGVDLNDHDQENGASEAENDIQEQDLFEQGQQGEEQDMDLTAPLITATVEADAASSTLGSVVQLKDRRGDRTHWILDSLVSPPSRFLKTQGEIGKGEYPNFKDGNEESLQDKEQPQDGGALSSKMLSSPSSSEHVLSSPFQLASDAHTYIQSQPEATPSSTAATAATSFTTKRTRSGTIVPPSHVGNISNTSNNTNDPPGTRRTRSGTLVGPLPLPSTFASGSDSQSVVLSIRRTGPPPLSLSVGVGARRTRSGTVIGYAPPLSVSVSGPGEKSTKETGLGRDVLEEFTPMDRSDRHHSGYDYLDGFNNAGVEVDMNGYIEPYIDALYMPRQSSSPDPIDFLRLAHFQDYGGMREKCSGFGFESTMEEQEGDNPGLGSRGCPEERMEDEMAWCIADEPPSPIVPKNKLGMTKRRYNKGGILSVGGGAPRGLRNKGRRGMRIDNGKEKGKGKTMRTRFMIDGHEEQPGEVMVEPEEGEDSDDELLLLDGSTLALWGDERL